MNWHRRLNLELALYLKQTGQFKSRVQTAVCAITTVINLQLTSLKLYNWHLEEAGKKNVGAGGRLLTLPVVNSSSVAQNFYFPLVLQSTAAITLFSGVEQLAEPVLVHTYGQSPPKKRKREDRAFLSHSVFPPTCPQIHMSQPAVFERIKTAKASKRRFSLRLYVVCHICKCN